MIKSSHFLLFKTTFSDKEYAKLYILELVRVHEVSLSIILDHAVQYTTFFWRSFQKDLATKAKLSIAFLPQTDGQGKRIIQTLEDMARTCGLEFEGSWNDYLHPIELAYKNSFYLNTQMEPFEALYGRRCRSLVGWFKVGEVVFTGPNLVM